MVKYLIIAGLMFCTTACKLGGSREKMICVPEAGILHQNEAIESVEGYTEQQDNKRAQREPLILLRILTEV
jgi:hypothetical protein